MDLVDVNALLAVVDHGSLQRAARARRVSRGALRRQVERLEAELEVALLVRGSRGVSLTPAGRELVDGAPALVRDVAQLTERVREASDRARGGLRFVVPTGMPVAPRARALVALREWQPDLDVDVVEDEDPLSRLTEPFDLMLQFGERVAEAGWYSQVLARFSMRLLATPAYLEANGTPTSPDAISAHPLLFFVDGASRQARLPVRRRPALEVEPWVRSSNLALLTALAGAGAGLAWLPMLPATVGGGADLVPVLDDVTAPLTLRALSPRSSRVDPRIRAMLKNARVHIQAALSMGAEPEAG